MNLLSRGLYYASGCLTKPASPHEAGLVKAHDVTALIVKQLYLVLFIALSIVVTAIFAPDITIYILSLAMGALTVLLYTCVGAKWVFRFRGAQQARQIYLALWKVQVLKFLLVVAFFMWASQSSWMKPEAAMLGMGLMQVLPLFSGRSVSSSA